MLVVQRKRASVRSPVPSNRVCWLEIIGCWFEIMFRSQRALLEHLFHPYVQFTRFSAFKFADPRLRNLGEVPKESNKKKMATCLENVLYRKQPNKTLLVWWGKSKQTRTGKGVGVGFYINQGLFL